jgi:hypothetical protein
MKLKFRGKMIPHIGVIVFIALGLWLTYDWPYETALFPRIGCIVVLIISVLSLGGEILSEGKAASGHSDAWVSSHLGGEKSSGRALIVFGSLILFMAGVWVFGYEFAAVAFVFLFMKFYGKQSWKMSVAFTVFSFVFLFSVFRLLLDVAWPPGMLWEMIGL